MTAILKALDWLNGQLSSMLNETRFPRGPLHGIPCSSCIVASQRAGQVQAELR